MNPIQTILVPIDFSAHSEKALDVALGMAKQCGATLHLLHSYPLQPDLVAPYGIVLPPDLDRSCREAAAKRLDASAARVIAAGVAVEAHASAALPADAIVGSAEDLGADLIVMGTRGLSGLKHMLIGSVTDRVLRLAPCPVMTVRGDASD